MRRAAVIGAALLAAGLGLSGCGAAGGGAPMGMAGQVVGRLIPGLAGPEGASAGPLTRPGYTAAEVAAYGYRAMMKGKRVAIHGWINNLLVLSLRIAPRQLAAAVTGRVIRKTS